jgi:hypothetical protein
LRGVIDLTPDDGPLRYGSIVDDVIDPQ